MSGDLGDTVRRRLSRHRFWAVTPLLVLAAAVILAACGGSGGTTTTSSTAETSESAEGAIALAPEFSAEELNEEAAGNWITNGGNLTNDRGLDPVLTLTPTWAE